MEKENNTYEDELDIENVEDVEEDSDEFEDIEEYDFNDEDDEFEDEESEPEDEELENEGDDVEESSEEDGKKSEDKKEDTMPPIVEKKADELTAAQKRELALLHKLGYDGTYEEATAAFDKETSAGDGDNSDNTPQKETEAPSPDYEAMAKVMLDEINSELGLNLTNYADFEDLATFADLSRQPGVGPVKAFKATNPKMMESMAIKAAMNKLSAPKRSAPTLPRMDGGKGGASREESISSAKIAEYRQMFPNMSRSDIIKLIKRGNKSIR